MELPVDKEVLPILLRAVKGIPLTSAELRELIFLEFAIIDLMEEE